MSNGVLGKAMGQVGSAVKVYEVPASGIDFATVNINCANLEASADVKVKISIGTGTNPTAMDYVDPEVSIPAKGAFERNYLTMSPGEKVFVESTSANLAVRVYGLEKAR